MIASFGYLGADARNAGWCVSGGGLAADWGGRKAGQEGAQTVRRDQGAPATGAGFDAPLCDQGIKPSSADP
jgi:hypothetical protein